MEESFWTKWTIQMVSGSGPKRTADIHLESHVDAHLPVFRFKELVFWARRHWKGLGHHVLTLLEVLSELVHLFQEELWESNLVFGIFPSDDEEGCDAVDQRIPT